MPLSGHAVVLTGAAGGIGKAIALAFAAEGADLVLGDLADGLDAVADEARHRGVRAVAPGSSPSRRSATGYGWST